MRIGVCLYALLRPRLTCMRPGDAKVAILLALMDMLEPIPIFFPQLQPTFVKRADESSSVAAPVQHGSPSVYARTSRLGYPSLSAGRSYQPPVLGHAPDPSCLSQAYRSDLQVPAQVPLSRPASQDYGEHLKHMSAYVESNIYVHPVLVSPNACPIVPARDPRDFAFGFGRRC